ncbi:MAG: PstS family phosphate ABC transporter substrate-binding protein [Cyanobacteria bacterium]|nr:PstS family phosphate ABC transporter substrate-binding protein [Cyanobacteriota bacterium]
MFKVKKRSIALISITVFLIFALSMFVFTGCKTASQQSETTLASESSTNQDNSNLKFGNQTLILTGSTTLLEVAQKWAEEFMKVNGGKITVNGGGSGEGIAALLNGTTDLANASRSIKQDEIDKAKSLGLDIKEYTVLYDGICIVTSKNINIKELTTDQLADIYMGKITNWKEVGGPDVNITAVARDTNSGTGEYFLEEIIQKGKTQKENDYSPNCLRLQSNGDVVNQVANNDNTIGYIGIGYLKDAGNTVNTVAVKKGDKEAIIPTAQSVADKTYPISRALYIYANTKNIPAIAQAYIDFVLSNDGQKIGEEAGFVKVK